MDLLAPFKMCLQCLPVFSISHPSPPLLPSPVSVAPSHAISNNSPNSCVSASAMTTKSSENDFQEGEKPSFSDASLSFDHQHQDLPVSEHAKELGSPAFAAVDLPLSEHAKKLGSHVLAWAKPSSKGEKKHVQNDASDNANQEVVKNTAPSNDVKSSTPGLMPPPSPITPAPIGLGYIIGQHSSSHHIHQQVNSRQNERHSGHSGHSFFHSHSHGNASPSSHSTQDEQHTHLPFSSSGDGDEEHAHHQHSHKQIIDAKDDTPPLDSPQHVQVHHTHVDHLDSFHSMPDIELANAAHGKYDSFDKDTNINGSSSTLETSQSERIEGAGTAARMRRRDQIKNQLKDIRNQLKQGGHHLKEEGSKQLQSMVSNMNKQIQDSEKFALLSIHPRD